MNMCRSGLLDRISGLPDTVLHHILSLLPTKQVVQTCILSKRWISLWRYVTSLDFDQDLFLVQDPNRLWNSMKQGPIDFVKFVDSVMFLRDQLSNIQSLRLWFDEEQGNEDMSMINTWISVAISRNIEVLDIKLYDSAEFIPRLFTCSPLKVLKLKSSYQKLNLPSAICLPSLQTLCLTGISVEAEGLTKLISSCSNLGTLILDYCDISSPNDLFVISNPQLETLIIKGHIPFIEIFAPRLVHFKIEGGDSKVSTCLIKSISNFESLVDADINIGVNSSRPTKQFLRALCSAKSLTFHSMFIVSFGNENFERDTLQWIESPEAALEWIQFPFNNLKFLKLGTWFTDGEVPVINKLLRFSPTLETLVIKNDGVQELLEEKSLAENVPFEYKLSLLKSVEFLMFQGAENEVKFVKFFMNNAVKLEKLIIKSPNRISPNKKVLAEIKNISKLLLTHPRLGNLSFDATSDDCTSVTCSFV
ncbi:Fbd-associated f-box protein [Thalictrum thalictroides]|uniref:Fbd-associated f-box protein n=1 Tax=Thalictrum thalictroides TaxID=46969 RepID=A0A7J6VK85_THATH|nr:Fbd-associated f-box protein [Thalictrum thalictroides]